MKTITLLFLFFATHYQSLFSQDSLNHANRYDSMTKSKTYIAYVYLQNQRRAVKSYLVAIRDSSIFLSASKIPYNFNSTRFDQQIGYQRIDEVRLKRRGSTLRAVLIGVVLGAILGAAIGHSNGDDKYTWFGMTANEKAYLGAYIGAGAGVLTGLAVDQITQRRFYIRGEWKSLEEMKQSLNQ